MTFKFILDHWGAFSSGITAVGAGIALIWRRVLRRRIAKYRLNLKRLAEIPDTLKESEAMKEELAVMQESLNEIAGQLKPNGGQSIRDILDRLETELHLLRAANWATRSVTGDAIWQSDRAGRWTDVSAALSEMVGLDQSDVLNNGWVAALHKEDRQRIYSEWMAAVEQGRQFNETFRLRHADGTILTVSGHATPLRDKKGEMQGLIGALQLVADAGH